MATSAASKPFTVKGTRWMCTVWFVAFLWRQRGWAWVFTATNVRRAVRMAAPCAFLDVLCAAVLFGCQCQPDRLRMPMLMPAPAPKINHLQACSRGRARTGRRELLPSPSGTYAEACGFVLLLLVSYRPLAQNSNWLCVLNGLIAVAVTRHRQRTVQLYHTCRSATHETPKGAARAAQITHVRLTAVCTDAAAVDAGAAGRSCSTTFALSRE